MLIVLTADCTDAQRQHLVETVEAAGCRVEAIRDNGHTVLTIHGDTQQLHETPLHVFAGVQKVVPVTPEYKLASLEHHEGPTVVRVGDVSIGGGAWVVIAGPCAVEDRETLHRIARAVRDAGADLLRGGAWKPRTSPYSFRGLGHVGLEILREVSQEVGLPTVTEVLDPRHVAAVAEHADMLQIGTRNMSNFELLVEVGQTGKPVLLKRARSATITDWLLAAEYVLGQGNPNVVLCERGIRGFDTATRNVLDLAAIPAVRARSHLPIVIDPSHATGHARYVQSMARAACAAGADGVMVEVHVDPEHARSDADQALLPEHFAALCDDLRRIRAAL